MHTTTRTRIPRRVPALAAYSTDEVFNFILSLFSVFNGLVVLVNNVVALIEDLFDGTDA